MQILLDRTWLYVLYFLIISFWGGLNGWGEWKDYIKEIESIINEYEDSWVVDLENDCLDDLWYLRLGYRIKDFEQFYTKKLKNIIKKTNNLEGYVVKVMEGCSYIVLGKTQYVDEESTKKIMLDKEIGMIIKTN